MVPPIFKDAALQEKFNKQGFVTIPFLNEDEVRHMDKFFDELHPTLPASGFVSGSYSSDFDYKKRISEEIKIVYKRAYEQTFQNYTPFGGTFLYKISSPDSFLNVHQDWSVVNEEREVALNVWTPFCDIDSNNGPLMVLPGSHYDAFPVLRAPTLPQFFGYDLEIVMQELVPVLVKAGEAVILNQSLIHYSPPNVSGKIRKAVTAGVKTKDAQMIFHYKDANEQGNRIEKFEMDDDFFIHFNDFFSDIQNRPYVGKSVGFIDYEVPILRGNELREKINGLKKRAGFALNQPERSSVFSKIKQLLRYGH